MPSAGRPSSASSASIRAISRGRSRGAPRRPGRSVVWTRMNAPYAARPPARGTSPARSRPARGRISASRASWRRMKAGRISVVDDLGELGGEALRSAIGQSDASSMASRSSSGASSGQSVVSSCSSPSRILTVRTPGATTRRGRRRGCDARCRGAGPCTSPSPASGRASGGRPRPTRAAGSRGSAGSSRARPRADRGSSRRGGCRSGRCPNRADSRSAAA